jgi:hypothetical protein
MTVESSCYNVFAFAGDAVRHRVEFEMEFLMLVGKFKFRRNHDKDSFPWTAESEFERSGIYRGFHAVGRTLFDVKEFAALVRWCERTGTLERLSAMHPPGFESRLRTTWGGTWYPFKRDFP